MWWCWWWEFILIEKREKKASKSQARDSESLFELFTWVANDFNSQFTLEGELKCLMKREEKKNPEVASRRSRTKSWLGNLARLIFRGNLALARLAHRRKELKSIAIFLVQHREWKREWEEIDVAKSSNDGDCVEWRMDDDRADEDEKN